MRTNCLYIVMIAIATITPQIYTMEHCIALATTHKKTWSAATLHNYKLLKQFDDAFYKTFSCSTNKERHNLQLTCKHFYAIFSIKNLNNLITHDFDINKEKEKTAFFKNIIKKNKAELIPVILNHASKKIKDQKSENIIIELGDTTQKEKEELRLSYTTPLLKEALKQNNYLMINALEQDEFDTKIVDDYYEQQSLDRKKKCCECFIQVCCPKCYYHILVHCLSNGNICRYFIFGCTIGVITAAGVLLFPHHRVHNNTHIY